MTWEELLQEEFSAPYYRTLREQVRLARVNSTVYPPEERELYALKMTPPEKVRVVILGQDPYHGAHQAMGLAFSVEQGTDYPPSLRNIFQELKDDVGAQACHGDLSAWARQGVLLLNTVLTVEEGKANSHAEWGWQRFTDAVIAATNRLPQPIVFVLWGAQARKKTALITQAAERLILKAPHPSPLSAYRGFFGSKPFSKINAYLLSQGQTSIDWNILP